MTRSLEEAIIRAQSAVAVAVQGVWDKLVAVERVTRPPRLGHDVDVVDGAEQLARAEEEQECAPPAERSGLCMHALTIRGQHFWCDQPEDHEGWPHGSRAAEAIWGDAGISSVYDDEDRFPPAPDWHNAQDRLCVYTAESVDSAAICGVCRPVRDIVEQMIDERFGGHTTDNLAAGARAAGSSPSEVSGPSSPPWPPSEGCTNPPRSDPLAAVRGEGGAPDSGIQQPPGAPQPDLSASDLWAAANYAEHCAVCETYSANSYRQERLFTLATRLRDASRAMRDQK